MVSCINRRDGDVFIGMILLLPEVEVHLTLINFVLFYCVNSAYVANCALGDCVVTERDITFVDSKITLSGCHALSVTYLSHRRVTRNIMNVMSYRLLSSRLFLMYQHMLSQK